MTPERMTLVTPNIASLGIATKEEYLRRMEIAPNMTIDLALLLQRIAFPDKEIEYLAPLYLAQAAEITMNYEIRQELIKAINKIQEL